MDRLLSLRNLDANTSLSSEGGYETANDDSVSSLYYSINNDTLTDDISSPVSTVYDAESTIIVCDEPYATNVNGENANAAGLQSDSAPQSSPEQTIATINFQTISSSPSNASAEQPILVEPEVSLMQLDPLAPCATNLNGEGASNILSTESTQTSVEQASNVSAEQPEMSSIRQECASHGPDATALNRVGNSQIVTLPQHQNQTNNAVHPPNPSQAARRAIQTLQENDPPRRHVMARRTVITQLAEIPRRSVVPLSRRNQVVPNGLTENQPRPRPKPAEIPQRSVMPLSRRNQVVPNGLTENQPRPRPKPAESHICDICKKSFPLRSTLIVHGKSHNIQCQFCDKKFQKELALSIHHRDNCEKIPFTIRRNILAKEFKSLSSGK